MVPILTSDLLFAESVDLRRMDSATARATFELVNDISNVSSVDAIFKYNHAQQQELLSAKPWAKE